MLNEPILFVTIPYSVISNGGLQSCHSLKQIGANILIDSKEIDLKLIVEYVSKFDYPVIFSFADIIINSDNSDVILSQYYTLFTLFPNSNNNRSIPVFTNDTESQAGAQEIIRYFKKQGQADVKLVFFELDKVQVKENILMTDVSLLRQFDGDKLADYYDKAVSRVILLPVNSVGELKDKLTLLKSIPGDNQHTKLFFAITALRRNSNWVEKQSRLWQQRAKLYLSFVHISKKLDKNQYYELQKWYNNEYEVLPIWYKRLGHVIKVITGKRTFRSLFDDSAKKHKL